MADRDTFTLTPGLLDNDFVVVRVEMENEPAVVFLLWGRFCRTFLLGRYCRPGRNLFNLLGWRWYGRLQGSRPRGRLRGLSGTFASPSRILLGPVGRTFALFSAIMERFVSGGRRNRCRL